MTTVTSKALAYVLRSLYPASFASYQGIVFRVTGPGQGALRGISADTMSTDMHVRLADQNGQLLLKKAETKLETYIKEDTGRTLDLSGKLRIITPKKVDLRFDESLDMVYCSDPRCGTLDSLSWIRRFQGSQDSMPRCRFCRQASVQQAPIWIPQRTRRASIAGTRHALLGDSALHGVIRNMGIGQLLCYYHERGDRCTSPESKDGKCVHDLIKKLGSLKMADPQRPVDSLRRHNPHCPKNLNVPLIKLERLYRKDRYWYKMDFPRESMTVPLQVSAVETYDIAGDPEVTEVNEILREVKPVVLNGKMVDIENSRFTRMRVLEITYGFRIGSTYSGVSSYYVDGQENNVLGRLTETQGFVLTLKPDFSNALEDKSLKNVFGNVGHDELMEIALHSIKHSLLVLAPMYSGFEPEKFSGSFDISRDKNRVFVYDTDEGGNGGFASLMRNGKNFIEMLKRIELTLGCPRRECKDACKLCLFIKNCGYVNRKLNRHLVRKLEIFNRRVIK